jgi:hypothetical protein
MTTLPGGNHFTDIVCRDFNALLFPCGQYQDLDITGKSVFFYSCVFLKDVRQPGTFVLNKPIGLGSPTSHIYPGKVV